MKRTRPTPPTPTTRRRRDRFLAVGFLAFVLVAAPPTAAQMPLEDDPGFFPLDELGLLHRDELSIEINLHGAMLSMISALLGTDDPELAELVAGLRGVRVRSAELSAQRLQAVGQGVGEASAWLDAHGWQPIVRVREPGEEVYVYLRGDGETMDGLTILAIDESEATVVNLIGSIDLGRLSVIVEGFDLPSSAVGEATEERP